MKKGLTPFECKIAEDFANKIVDNIDQRDFMDGRNTHRSKEKLFEDSSKGKKAEIFIFNVLGDNGIKAEVDFNIYKKGIGDNGDVIANNKSIDVKASSPRARCLMIEEKRVQIWDNTDKAPNCLCMVAVNGDTCEYLFGIGYKSFRKKAKLIKRGENIPNTKVPLKASNYVLERSECGSNIESLVRYIKR